MYLDPPYNQHRYFTNYHVWETLVRWDEPAHYGIACKRVDARDDAGTRSVFNSKQQMPAAMASLLGQARAEVLVVSCNDESWISPEAMTAALQDAGRARVEVVAFDSKRYVGAQIGVHGPTGRRSARSSAYATWSTSSWPGTPTGSRLRPTRSRRAAAGSKPDARGRTPYVGGRRAPLGIVLARQRGSDDHLSGAPAPAESRPPRPTLQKTSGKTYSLRMCGRP